MSLPLTTPEGSTYRSFYSGPVGVAGMSTPQAFDLSLYPDHVLEDPTFADNWRIFVRQVSAEVLNVQPQPAFTYDSKGKPTEILLLFDSTNAAALVDIEFWFVHSVVR